ncbi:MAG TPA: TonB-dependent receptor [Polyangia bacterium]|nr:TonB-dependent receptor [Polyangia bacterium]
MLAAVSLLGSSPAVAQLGSGTLTGKVVDASSKQPLADVVVTATSPALQGEQTVVTDKSGAFRIPTLPPGVYTLRYEGETYRPYSRGGIQLLSTVTLRVDAELLPETLRAEEVTIVARPPTVDVGSARSGVTIGNEFTSRIAVAPPGGKGGGARSFEQLADIAPTSRNDLYGASIAGTTSPENQYMIDGISVGDPGFGYNGTPLSIEFIKETSIVTGGYLPEYGRGGGGVLDVVTKSGSNEFHGSVFGNYTPWQKQPRFPLAQDAISTSTRLDSVRDIGFDLGGPIVKDKLWFYLGADLSSQTFALTRDLNSLQVDSMTGKYRYNDEGFIVSEPIAGTRRKYLAEQTAFQYIGKLTYSPTSDDRLELNHRGTPSRSGGDGNYSVDYETGLPTIYANPGSSAIIGPYSSQAWRQIFDAYDTSLKWTHSSLNKRLTFDTILGWHNEHSANLASDGSSLGVDGLSGTPLYVFGRTNPAPHPITDFENLPDPSVCINPVMDGDPRCPTGQYAVGGPQILQDRKYNRYQAREIVTLVTPGLGHHIIKAGAEFEYMGYSSGREYPGGSVYLERAGGTSVNDFRRYGGLTAPDAPYTIPVLRYDVKSLSFGAFAQDSWSILDKITLNYGLRYDTQGLYADQGRGLILPNQLSPRLGVIFDPTQKGRAKIFANYAIYYQTLPLNIMDRAGSGEPQIRSRRPVRNCSPTPPAAADPATCDNPDNLLTLGGPSSPDQKWIYLSTGKLAIDPDLKPESSTEISAGGEYEIIPDGRVGLTYIHREMNNVIEDMSRDEGTTFFLGNPGSGIATDFPKAERKYDAGILHFTKVFSNLWLAQASYTLSYLRGRWEGLFRSATGQLDPGTNSDFDIISLTVNQYGPLAGDHTHEFKVFVARDVPLAPQHHLNLGLTARARSGTPTNYFGTHATYGNGEVLLLPRGSGERMPWVSSFDLHVGYAFLQTKNQTFAITADIFNLFNQQAVTRRSQNYTFRPVRPITGDAAKNPFVPGSNNKVIDPTRIQAADGDARAFDDTDRDRTFGAPLEYQDPITIRFGVKSTF